MSEHPVFAIAAALILGYGLFSKLAEKSIVTPPMVFVFLGVIASFFTFDITKVGMNAPEGKMFRVCHGIHFYWWLVVYHWVWRSKIQGF